MRYHEIVSEGRTINIDGKSPFDVESRMLRFFENPSVSQVISLAARFDLRGTSDGNSVFVWDASQIIHHNARYWLRHDGDFTSPMKLPDGRVIDFDNKKVPYGYNFYVINKKIKADKETREEWASSKRCDFYLLDEMTVLCTLKDWGQKISSATPHFARLVQGALMIPTTRAKPVDQSSSSSSPVPGSITA
jgi:hypothetical protein